MISYWVSEYLLPLARFLSFLGYALEHDSGLSLPKLPDSGCTLGHDPDLGNLAIADILSFFPQTIVISEHEPKQR